MSQSEEMILDGQVKTEAGRNDVYFERHFDVPADRLWSIVTTPELMAGWIGGPVRKLELEEGGDVEILIHPAGPATVYGKVFEYDPGHVVALTWEVPAWGPVPALVGTTMRWEVLPDGDGSKFILTHSLPVEAGRVPMFLGAWHAHLDEIPAALAGEHIAPFADTRMFGMREKYENKLASTN